MIYKLYVVHFITALKVTVETVTRDCVSVPKNDPEFSDGCHDKLPQNQHVRNILKSSLDKISIGEATFTGKTCYTSYSSGTNQLKSWVLSALICFVLSVILNL